MAFHPNTKLAQTRLEQIETDEAYTELRPLARWLNSKYTNDLHLHSALCLLIAPSAEDAARMAMADLKTFYVTPMIPFLRAIAAGPEEWLADEDFFYKKGLMCVRGKHRPLPGGLQPDDDFRAVREKIDPALANVLARVVHRATGNDGLSRPVLLHVAVQLMPKGMEKDARLNAMSQTMLPEEHAKAMFASGHIIHQVARTIPGFQTGLLADVIAPPQKPVRERPVADRPVSRLAASAARHAGVRRQPTASNDRQERTLLGSLSQLVAEGIITPVQRDLHIALSHPLKAITPNQAMLSFKLTRNEVESYSARTGKALRELGMGIAPKASKP
jgi:hypothetical protein